MHTGRGQKIPAIKAAEEREKAEELAEKARLAKIHAERDACAKSIEKFIEQKEAEIKALEWQIRQKKGIIKGKNDEERMKRFDRFARGTRRTWDFVLSPIQWVKGVLLRGGGNEKDKLGEMMKARFPKLRDIERKKAEAQQLIARLNALMAALERDPASWVRKLNGKQITKVLDEEHF